MSYIVVSGYYNPGKQEIEDFFRIWVDNNRKFLKPAQTYIVNAGCKQVDYGDCEWVNLTANLGHVLGMPAGQLLGGWSASFLMGCFLAYHCKCDLLFKEQDCLAFGNYIDVLYKELGNNGMIVGRYNTSPACAGLMGQALVLARHSYLLKFIQAYLSIVEADNQAYPERKFDYIMKSIGGITQMSLGYDRSRPVNCSDPAFYLQQITPEELVFLRSHGFI